MNGKYTNLDQSACAIARSLGTVGDWWSLLIMRDALSGTRRFNEFQKNIGLAKNILSARLQKLVERGILEMAPASDGSAYLEYVATPKGEKLNTIIVALWQWGEEFCFKPGELTYDMVDKKTLKPLQRIKLQARDGRSLAPKDIRPLNRPASQVKKKRSSSAARPS